MLSDSQEREILCLIPKMSMNGLHCSLIEIIDEVGLYRMETWIDEYKVSKNNN